MKAVFSLIMIGASILFAVIYDPALIVAALVILGIVLLLSSTICTNQRGGCLLQLLAWLGRGCDLPGVKPSVGGIIILATIGAFVIVVFEKILW